MPASFAPFLAVAATVCEIVLSVTLVFGIATRIASIGAALLLLMYAVAMSISFGFPSQLYYAVLELGAAAWLPPQAASRLLAAPMALSHSAR